MKRLNFLLPDFVRISWVSDNARETWAPRFQRITQAWMEIEWLSVLAGVRDCGVTIVTPEEFVAKAGKWAENGLNALPVELQGLPNASYASTSVPVEPGKPSVFRVVIGTPASVVDFKKAWDANDNQAIGNLLGYPACCQEFFHHTWVKKGLVDTTWAMTGVDLAASNGKRSTQVEGPFEANILWRWVGIRAVPHLPCRFDCQPTVELGQKFIEVGRQSGYVQEMDWLLEILSWPVEWSALHGIAEIKTPILKVSTRTDATPVKYTVQRSGKVYPSDGAQGLVFPYSIPKKHKISQSSGYQRGLENPLGETEIQPDWYAWDNGFENIFAMDAAHKPIIDLVNALLSGEGGHLLDLGCGNGVLLKKIVDTNPEIVPYGIDQEQDRIEHACILLPKFAANFVSGDLFHDDFLWPEDRNYRLVILMPGRLLEASPESVAKLLSRVKNQSDYLLVYAYGDWLTRYGDLAGLAHKAGLRLLSLDVQSSASLARIKALPISIQSRG